MHQEITVSLPLLIVLAFIGIIVVALIAALITRQAVIKRVRREHVDAIVTHLASLFHRGQLDALRYTPDNEHLYAVGSGGKQFSIPVRESQREFSPTSFVGIAHEDLCGAIARLKEGKQFQTVDWHEESGKKFKDLKLRPEFLRRDQARA